jgi:RimJ/RimL family protein N-acetyltransferase
MIGLSEDSTIVTPRLTLRSLRAEDADEMVDVLADPSLHEFTGGEPATLDELRARYASLLEGSGSSTELWLNWIVRRTEDAVAVGTVQATIMNPDAQPTAEVAWVIGSVWQRRGYAGEAAVGLVQWLIAQGIESVAANIHAEHRASAAVATRAGLLPTSDVADGEVVWRLG